MWTRICGAIVAAAAATTSATPSNVARLVYAAAREFIAAAFLQWHQGARGRGTHIALFHLVSDYILRLGLLTSLWDNLPFVLKEDITCGAGSCMNWQTESIHKIKGTLHVPMELSTDMALAQAPDAYLLGPFTTADADVEPL